MSIEASSRTKILFFKSFPENMKKIICNRVFSMIFDQNIIQLNNLTYNHSCEGGFELPKTKEWITYLDSHNQKIHIYQSTRQFRFYSDNNDNIIGACCKDNINIFNDYELDTICKLVNDAINEIII